MIDILLHREKPQGQRAYLRIEITDNLFGEYSLAREWGTAGRATRHSLCWISNLREAVKLAEQARKRAMAAGFGLTAASPSAAEAAPPEPVTVLHRLS